MADGNVSAEQLRLFIERIERLEEEKKGIADDIKDVYGEAKATGYDTKTYEHIKNFYDTQAWIPKNAILVNAKSFDALDAPTKAAVQKAAADAEARGWKVAEEKNAEYKRLLAERGMKIHKPSPKLDADMRQEVQLPKLARALGADLGTPAGQQAVGEALTKASKALDIDVNPRFGTWDDQKMQLGDYSAPWITQRTEFAPEQPTDA